MVNDVHPQDQAGGTPTRYHARRKANAAPRPSIVEEMDAPECPGETMVGAFPVPGIQAHGAGSGESQGAANTVDSWVRVVVANLVEVHPVDIVDAEVGYVDATPAKDELRWSLRSRKVQTFFAFLFLIIGGMSFGLLMVLMDRGGATSQMELAGNAGPDGTSPPIQNTTSDTLYAPFPSGESFVPAPVPDLPASTVPLDMGSRWKPLGPSILGTEDEANMFGSSVAVSADGTTVAASGPLHEGQWGGFENGHVRVLRHDPESGAWVQLGGSIKGQGKYAELGAWPRSVDLSADGTVLAVAAPPQDADRGQVRVLVYDAAMGEWVQRGSALQGEEEGDEAGAAVALSADGSIIAIGAPRYRPRGDGESGQLRMFAWDGTASDWIQIGGAVGEEFDEMAESLAISADGSRVIVGAPFNEGGGDVSGAIRVFQRNGTGRYGLAQLGSDVRGERRDVFGRSVAMNWDGSIIAVGAPMYDTGRRGEVRTLQWNADRSSWEQIGQVLEGDVGSTSFGFSVALSADGTVLAANSQSIQSHESDDSGFRGYTKVFHFNPDISEWVQIGETLFNERNGDGFGHSMDLSADGTVLAIGSPQSKDGAGRVSVYTLT